MFKDTQQNSVRHFVKTPSQRNEETTKVAETHRADIDFTRHVVEFRRRGKRRATRCWPLVCRTACRKDYFQSYFSLQTTSKMSISAVEQEIICQYRNILLECVSREYSFMLTEAGYHLLGGFLRYYVMIFMHHSIRVFEYPSVLCLAFGTKE